MDSYNLISIEKARKEISDIDEQIFHLVSRRQQLSATIGQEKRGLNIPDKDFNREKACFDKAIKLAKELGLPTSFATSLQKNLMEVSLIKQEQDRIKSSLTDSPRSVSIIGGAGRMGRWLCHFFADSGHRITVIDKVQPEIDCRYQNELSANIIDEDIIVVATPIRTSIDILKKLAHLKPTKSVIFDVSSIKAPVKESLFHLRKQGLLVSSLHPMFGPSVELLFGKHIIRTSLGVDKADKFAADLFKNTSVTLVDMGFDEHDEIIAYLLSLSHLINIIFASVLSDSGFSIDKLSTFASTTFYNQLAIAKRVCLENPHLYYEIQALNPMNKAAYQRLSNINENILLSIKNEDEASFVKLMTKANKYLQGWDL